MRVNNLQCPPGLSTVNSVDIVKTLQLSHPFVLDCPEGNNQSNGTKHLHLHFSKTISCILVASFGTILAKVGQRKTNPVRRDSSLLSEILPFALQVICKSMVTVYNYLQVTNFFWMLVEGLYLHTMIVWAFAVEKVRLWHYVLLGWCKLSFLRTVLSFESPLDLRRNQFLEEKWTVSESGSGLHGPKNSTCLHSCFHCFCVCRKKLISGKEKQFSK